MPLSLSINRTRKWLIVAWSIYVFTFILQIIFLANYEDKAQLEFVWTNIIGSYITGCILILFFIIPLNKFLKNHSLTNKIIFLFFAGFFFCLLFIAIVTLIQSLILQKLDFSLYKNEFLYYLRFHFHNILKNYIFLTVLLFALDYFQRENFLIKKENTLKTNLVNAQLENLRSQFQPHFLFNALNSIVAVVDENKDKAQNMLVQLSDILRSSISNNIRCEQSLADEVRFLEKYLNIEKIRFETQLEYSFNIDPDFEQTKIPCLILQPLVENAIKHGFKRNRGILKIVITTDKGTNTIKVANNGAKLGRFVFGFGLNGVDQRLKILYDNKASFTIYQKENWVINEIHLPC